MLGPVGPGTAGHRDCDWLSSSSLACITVEPGARRLRPNPSSSWHLDWDLAWLGLPLVGLRIQARSHFQRRHRRGVFMLKAKPTDDFF